MQIMNLCKLQNLFNLFNPFMRTINLIVIHCSATREDKSFTEYDLDVCHRRRGFNGTGYHFYIRKNGDIKSTRPIERIGAHSRGFNKESIGICYEGGALIWQRTTERYPYRMAETFPAPGIDSRFIERLSELPDLRTSGSKSRPERKRRNRTGRNGSRPVLALMLKRIGIKSKKK